MWQLAWIVTRPPQEVRDALRSGGKLAIEGKAEQEFSECTMAELAGLFGAVSEQIKVYWSTAISHEEAPEGGSKEGSAAAHAPANPSGT